jgi:hypothetical protein
MGTDPVDATVGCTVVTVTGAGFSASADLACKFGTVVVVASYSSAAELSCMSPAVAAPATVALSVSINNADFSATTPFVYDRMALRSIRFTVGCDADAASTHSGHHLE